MSIASMILGTSGTGKSASLRNMDPAKTLLIQTINKPLPFKSKEWRPIGKDGGNIIVSADSATIVAAMQKTTRPVIIVDDFQYLLVTEFMARSHETGYTKFTDMAKNYYNVLKASAELDANKRVYLLSHTETNDAGQTQAKLLGKLLSEKVTVEGMVSIVLRTQVINGKYLFATQNNGSDTTKTPISMFSTDQVENDLNAIDKVICDYFEIKEAA